jgi:hypothetical protein
MLKGNLEVVELHVCLRDIQFDHSNDVYRMLNLESKRVINSRDVVWLEINVITWSRSKTSIEKLDACDDEDDFVAILAGNIAITSDISSNQQPALNKRSEENLYRRWK